MARFNSLVTSARKVHKTRRINVVSDRLSVTGRPKAMHVFSSMVALSLLLGPSQAFANDYDLSSQDRTIAAPTAGVINIGNKGVTRTINAGDMITPAWRL